MDSWSEVIDRPRGRAPVSLEATRGDCASAEKMRSADGGEPQRGRTGVMNQELDELLEIFGQEQACYTSLLDLSRKQAMAIRTAALDELVDVLGQKQHVLSRLSQIETCLRPYKQNWADVQKSLDEAGRQVLDLALATVEELLSELIAREKESEQLMEQHVTGADFLHPHAAPGIEGANLT
jgi:hypothetical protein